MSAAVLSLAVLGGLPLAGLAQTVPCISCAIARQDAAISAATNRAIVQQQLQADLQTRLGTQQATLQNQQALSTMQIQSSLLQNDWAMRQILLQEQLNILKLEASQRAAKPKLKKTSHKT
ncbi:MAG TPA: hypothetical protein VFW34_00450 [Candidatus Rubrimentiphilum sp.]|nr:hypothetical protein [Candidatus Rubrimentiphilum sp.]